MLQRGRILIKALAVLFMTAAASALPARSNAAMLCGPGACISACPDAEAACQEAGPSCHAVGPCYYDPACPVLVADCAPA
jgi:hypothetical protein